MKSPNVAPNFATRCRCLFASRESALVQVIGAGDVLPLGQVAQLVEQRTENPRVGSSILPLAIAYQLCASPRATWSAIAMMVIIGFTPLDVGKTLASATYSPRSS